MDMHKCTYMYSAVRSICHECPETLLRIKIVDFQILDHKIRVFLQRLHSERVESQREDRVRNPRRFAVFFHAFSLPDVPANVADDSFDRGMELAQIQTLTPQSGSLSLRQGQQHLLSWCRDLNSDVELFCVGAVGAMIVMVN